MKLNSKYFDGIRVNKKNDRKLKKEEGPKCNWKGCNKPGTHRAPKGRGNEGEYFTFCMDHVREYNKNYNYFSGMSDNQISDFQESALTGHRPTWALGVNKDNQQNLKEAKSDPAFTHDLKSEDAFNLFKDGKKKEEKPKPEKKRRPIRNLERKSLKTLHLDDTANAEEIKLQFKDLVKRHHPDLNGGDRDSEDRLREIIQAYNYLKQVGLC
ncbi:MAG: DnaJ domain-containing protein [Pseudomonadota bacterium]